MIKNLRHSAAAIALCIIPNLINAQAPDLGVAADFVLFSSTGAVTNTGLTQLTGNVGTNSGSSTGFGNVNGTMHDGGPVSAQCAADLLSAYNDLHATVPTDFPAPLLGNGQVLNAGVYEIGEAATLSLELILNGQNDPNAVFIFKIDGAFSTNALSRVKLINGAQACNVFWVTEGLVSMAAGTTMRGTVIANNAAIVMSAGDTLEGRALSTAGAVTVNGIVGRMPIGCGSPVLLGPDAPTLGKAGCFGIFSSDGPVENAGITHVMGDVGANVGLTTGFNPLFVSGMLHTSPNGSTAEAAADLLEAYNYLNGLAPDIALLYPAQFGLGLELTPHTYILNGGTTFTDTLYLNAQGWADAVFVIKVYGAFAASTLSKVKLTNGARTENVYWLVNGAIDMADYSDFSGTIVSQGAVSLSTGTAIDGRVLTGVGAVGTNAIEGMADMIPDNCGATVGLTTANDADMQVSVYPNPFIATVTLTVSDASDVRPYQLSMFNAIGAEVLSRNITQTSTTLDLSGLPVGIYLYRMSGGGTVVSGRMVSTL
jgi:hypothetical protein